MFLLTKAFFFFFFFFYLLKPSVVRQRGRSGTGHLDLEERGPFRSMVEMTLAEQSGEAGAATDSGSLSWRGQLR